MFMYYYCYVCSVLDILFHCIVLCIVLCKCILYYCHRLSTQLQLIVLLSYCFRPVHCPPNFIWLIDRGFFWGFGSSALWYCVVVVVVSVVSEKSAFETSKITDAASQRYFAEDLNSKLHSCKNFKFRSLFTACCLDGAISNWVTRIVWRENLCSLRRTVKCWHLTHISFKSKKMKWTGTCGTYGGEKKCTEEFVGEIWSKETTWKMQE